MRLKKARIGHLSDAEMSPDAKALMEPLIARGTDYNIFRTMARKPKAATAFLAWGSYILSKANSLPPRTRELAILRAGFNCKAGYEWAQHVLIGKKTGLTDEEIARIKKGAAAGGWSESDTAIMNATDDLNRNHFISDASWAALEAHFTPEQCVDLVYTVGQYTQVSMILNSLGVQLDDNLVLDTDFDGRA